MPHARLRVLLVIRFEHCLVQCPTDMNYFRTLITVADACPVTESVAPPDRGANKTVASLQHAMLADSPYVYTQEDVLFLTWFERQNMPHMSEEDIAHQRDEFFDKPQACLRASPLPKRYGWGLLFNEEGRVALCPMDSKEYEALVAGDQVTLLKAMRTRRA